MKKVVIVDDEAAGRQLIQEYLADYPQMVVLAECNNGVDAIKVINKFQPDLVFLDIQMPGLTGFEVLAHLEQMPQIIFSTAYDDYALKAFEVHALDYLLKPYTKERFAEAMKRINAMQAGYLEQLQDLAKNFQKPETFPNKILVQGGSKLIAVEVADIFWIDADGDYSRLITSKQNYLSNFGISRLQEKLNPEIFIRVHRSSIININFVKEVYKHAASYDIVMINGDIVKVSRSYLGNIKKLTF